MEYGLAVISQNWMAQAKLPECHLGDHVDRKELSVKVGCNVVKGIRCSQMH